MEQAVAGYANRLGEKLKRHDLATGHVTVSIHTSRFNDDEPQRSVSMTVLMPEATDDTIALIKASRRAVGALWQSSLRYSKAGIVTQDLVRPCERQSPLFDVMNHDRAEDDGGNGRSQQTLGRATVVPAAVGFANKAAFTTTFEMRSARYTTRWDELPKCT